jgi:hypothetical protein
MAIQTPHLLVVQLRFTRRQFLACLEPVPESDARRRIGSMNCLSWIVGHLANQEHRYWVQAAQGRNLAPELNELVGYGKPASTPDLAEMWAVWHTVTQAADVYLDTLTPALLQTHFEWEGQPVPESVGTMLLRNIYHYWFHTGEARTIREMLGHSDLPEYVGDMSQAPYQPEQ